MTDLHETIHKDERIRAKIEADFDSFMDVRLRRYRREQEEGLSDERFLINSVEERELCGQMERRDEFNLQKGQISFGM